MMSNRPQGFTLIEVMIVVTIIGIMAGVVAVSVDFDGGAKAAEKEAKRFRTAMSLALDEAAFNQKELGVHIFDDSYEFLVWQRPEPAEESEEEPTDSIAADNPNLPTYDAAQDPANQDPAKKKPLDPIWQLFDSDKTFQAYELPEDMRVDIRIDSSELVDSGNNGETELTETNLNLDDIGPNIEEQEKVDPPHVYILSSGEFAPAFEIGFYHVDYPDKVVVVIGDELGRVKLEGDGEAGD